MIKGTDLKLLKKYNDILPGNKAYKRPNKFNSNRFIVCHYAGEVEYDIESFLDKNRDTVSDLINDTMTGSQS
jgi:myosin heavy subunit